MCGKYKTVYCVPFQSFKLFTLECRQILIPYPNMKSKSSHIPQQIFFHARCEFDTLSSVFSGFVAKWRLRSTSVFRGKWSVPCLTLVCFKVDTSFMQWQKKKKKHQSVSVSRYEEYSLRTHTTNTQQLLHISTTDNSCSYTGNSRVQPQDKHTPQVSTEPMQPLVHVRGGVLGTCTLPLLVIGRLLVVQFRI